MDVLTVFAIVAAAMAALSLFNGVNAMAHGGAHSNEFMWKRVGWQGLALLFVLLALVLGPGLGH